MRWPEGHARAWALLACLTLAGCPRSHVSSHHDGPAEPTADAGAAPVDATGGPADGAPDARLQPPPPRDASLGAPSPTAPARSFVAIVDYALVRVDIAANGETSLTTLSAEGQRVEALGETLSSGELTYEASLGDGPEPPEGLYAVDPTGEAVARALVDPATLGDHHYERGYARYSVDRSRVAFAARDAAGTRLLWQAETHPGTGPPRLARSEDGTPLRYPVHLRWAPDAQWLVAVDDQDTVDAKRGYVAYLWPAGREAFARRWLSALVVDAMPLRNGGVLGFEGLEESLGPGLAAMRIHFGDVLDDAAPTPLDHPLNGRARFSRLEAPEGQGAVIEVREQADGPWELYLLGTLDGDGPSVTPLSDAETGSARQNEYSALSLGHEALFFATTGGYWATDLRRGQALARRQLTPPLPGRGLLALSRDVHTLVIAEQAPAAGPYPDETRLWHVRLEEGVPNRVDERVVDVPALAVRALDQGLGALLCAPGDAAPVKGGVHALLLEGQPATRRLIDHCDPASFEVSGLGDGRHILISTFNEARGGRNLWKVDLLDASQPPLELGLEEPAHYPPWMLAGAGARWLWVEQRMADQRGTLYAVETAEGGVTSRERLYEGRFESLRSEHGDAVLLYWPTDSSGGELRISDAHGGSLHDRVVTTFSRHVRDARWLR